MIAASDPWTDERDINKGSSDDGLVDDLKELWK